MLVVSPLKSMLDDIHSEMVKLGHSRWGSTRWRFCAEGLWSSRTPSGHGRREASRAYSAILICLALSEASTVVFLSPQLTYVQFTQATGRVVRQGSFHTRVRVIILAAAGTQETEDAEKIERFCQIACEHSSGTSSGACL